MGEFPQYFTARLGSVSTLWEEHRIGGLQAIPKKIPLTPGMQAMNHPRGKLPVLSCGEGIQTNMRTGMGSPAFWGITPMTLLNVLITRSYPDGGESTGALQEEASVTGCCSTSSPMQSRSLRERSDF